MSPQRLTIYLYSAHGAVIFAIAQLSCYKRGIAGQISQLHAVTCSSFVLISSIHRMYVSRFNIYQFIFILSLCLFHYFTYTAYHVFLMGTSDLTHDEQDE